MRTPKSPIVAVLLFIVGAVGIVGDVDFVVTRLMDPGWMENVAEFLISPPSWFTGILFISGLLFAGYAIRESRRQPQLNGQSDNRVLAQKVESGVVKVKPDILFLEPSHRYSLIWDPPNDLQIITRPILKKDETEPLGTRLPVFRIKNVGGAVAHNIKLKWEIPNTPTGEMIRRSARMMRFGAQLWPDRLALKVSEQHGTKSVEYPYVLNETASVTYLSPQIDNVSYLEVAIPPLLYHTLEMMFVATIPENPLFAVVLQVFYVTIFCDRPENTAPKKFQIEAIASSSRPSAGVRIPIGDKMREPPEIMAEVKFHISEIKNQSE